MSRRIKRTVPPGERARDARPHRGSSERMHSHRPGSKTPRFQQKREEKSHEKHAGKRSSFAPEPVKAKPKPEAPPLPTKVQTVVVTPDEDNMRVDRFLEARFPGLSFSHIQRIVRKGELRVNGKRADSKDRLEEGQSVRIPPLKLDTPRPTAQLSEAGAKTLAALREMTIYEDDDVLVLNKPAGLAVQGGSGTTRHVDQMLEVMRDAKGQKPRLVHRLDKETSGCLLVAQDLLGAGCGRSEAEAGPHLDLSCERGERGRQHHAHRRPWRRGREPRGDLLCRGGERRPQARLGLAETGHRPHPSAARAYGPYRAPDHRRPQIFQPRELGISRRLAEPPASARTPDRDPASARRCH